MVSTTLARNTFYLTLASVGQKVIAFVYFLFLARVMEPERTGTYFLAISIAIIFSVIADFGITPVVIREIAKMPSEAVKHIRHALGTKIPFMVLSVVFSILATIFLGYDPVILELVLIATAVLILDSIHLLFYGALRGVQQLRYEAFGMFTGMLVTGTLGGLVLFLSPSLHLLVFALLAGSIVNVIISVSNAVKILGKEVVRPLFNVSHTKRLLKIAFPFALAAIFVKVFSYVDTIFISKFLDTTAVGIYSIAYKFTYAFQFLPLAFTAALYPGLSELVGKDSKALKEMFVRGMWYMMILATPIALGLWVIAPEAVLLAGSGYAESAIVLQLLAFVLIPIFLDFPVGSLLNAANRQSLKTTIVGITMVINVILNAILIPQVGLPGAAYAALASFSFMFLTELYFIPKIIPSFSIWQLVKKLAPILFSGFVMLGFAVYLKPLVGWIAVIPIAGIVYMVSLLLTRSVTTDDLLIIKKTISNRV